MSQPLYSIYTPPTQNAFSVNTQQDPIVFDPVNCIIEPSVNEGGLYLGGIEIASDVSALKALNIRAVLTIASNANVNYTDGSVKYHEVIEVEDVPQVDLYSIFEKAIAFIDSCRKETSVLIHCFQGVSRSATIVLAYLMCIYGLSFERAFSYTRERRKQVYPNSGFLNQIRTFENYLKNRAPPQPGIVVQNKLRTRNSAK